MEEIRALLYRKSPVKWLFTGDSITHGALHTAGWRDYTELFSERVRWEMKRGRDVIIKTGIGGRTLTMIRDDLEWNVLQFQPDCVSIMVGMNDCVGGAAGMENFRSYYRDVIARIRCETEAILLLHTPNTISAQDDKVRMRYLPQYAQVVREIATETGSAVIDHFAEWELAGNNIVRQWLADDGYHPNVYGHRALTVALLRALEIWDDDSRTCRLEVPR